MTTLTGKTLTQDQLERYERDGFLAVPQLFTPQEVATYREAFTRRAEEGLTPPLFDLRRFSGTNDPLARYPRMMHPHKYPSEYVGPLAMDFLLDPRIGNILVDLFGGDEPIAAQTMFYYKPPGARGQDLHQDNFYLKVKPGNCMAAWLAVDDADRDNGGMVMVPGSHKLDIACPEQSDSSKFFTTEHVPTPAGYREVPIDLKAGDVLFFNGSVIHGSYPNESKTRFRRALIGHYVPDGCTEVGKWYRPLYKFNGEEAMKEEAMGSGPCGTVEEPAVPVIH
jgi:phytanoyl-CoA hydroxylase